MFVIGAMIGYAVETIFILAVTGQYEIRSSLVFGPFNIIYGAGTVVLYAGLSRIDRRSTAQIFVLGALVCTVVELVCSVLQELVFGSTSWDYSWAPFNLNGRVCLLFSLGWGFLAVLFTRVALPACETGLSAIPLHIMRPLTLILLTLLVLDATLSAAAVARWTMRLEGMPALSLVDGWIDRLFPNETMGKIYANMQQLR
ncbi:MAG: putative ABC transporter permease [Coriobacteriales bacterium]|jgi:uncharacterized membrane protein|nr:putative ABC transporter permease [Coriobacteriales bacterium]